MFEAEYTEKPDWNDAPYWANYRAQEPSGAWLWFENCPEAISGSGTGRIPGWHTTTGKVQKAERPWKDTLERRPFLE